VLDGSGSAGKLKEKKQGGMGMLKWLFKIKEAWAAEDGMYRVWHNGSEITNKCFHFVSYFGFGFAECFAEDEDGEVYYVTQVYTRADPLQLQRGVIKEVLAEEPRRFGLVTWTRI